MGEEPGVGSREQGIGNSGERTVVSVQCTGAPFPAGDGRGEGYDQPATPDLQPYSSPGPRPPAPGPLVVFHTNDFHNKLTSGQAERLREIKESAPGSLLLDCGDAIWSGNVYFRPGEPILRLMNRAGYDAMCMGNREFHFLATGLRHKIGWAEFPVLCANIRSTNGSELPVRSDITLERNGLKIVVFGLTVPMITERMLSRKVSAYVFDDPIETAKVLVPELRKRADILIALTHIGLAKDRELASSAPGIDLVVGGHTHAVLERPEMAGQTAIVQAGWFAHHVGKVEIGPGGKVTGELLQLVPPHG